MSEENYQKLLEHCQQYESCDPAEIAAPATKTTSVHTEQAVNSIEESVANVETTIMIVGIAIAFWGLTVVLMLGGILAAVNKIAKNTTKTKNTQAQTSEQTDL